MWMKWLGCHAGCQGISRYHRSYISGIHCMKATKHTSKESTLVLKPMVDVTRSRKQGYQWPHKKGLIPPKKFLKSVVYFLLFYYLNLCTEHFCILKWISLIEDVRAKLHFKIIQNINAHILVRNVCHSQNTREGYRTLRNI